MFPPPEPLPPPRQLLATTGYAVTTIASGALFDVPGDVAFDSEKNAFISNFNWSTNQGGILKLSPSGALSAFHAKPTNSIPANDAGTDLLCTSLLFDVPGDVSGLQNYLYTFALPSAVPHFLFDVGQDRGTVPRTPVPLSSITIGTVADAAYDGAGNILIADTDRGHTAIRLLTPDGMVSYVAHVANAFGSSATSLDVGPTGIIYCTVGNQIWQVKPGGVVSVLAGTLSQGFLNGPAAVASFRFPSRVVYGPDGYLYVSDQGNNAIRRVSLDGQVTTIAGDGTAGNTDGVGAAARFNFPLGLRFGPDGNLYVADSFNNLIRKITFPSSLELGVSDPGDPSDRSGAFSPNADGSKDTINLHVTATKNWTLTATDVNGGEATIAAGAGQEEPQTINWDGEVNGVTLPDGKYPLRLKAGGQEKMAEVIIDTTPPKISDAYLDGYDETLSRDSFYTFLITAADQGSGSAVSNIEAESGTILFKNATCTREGKAETVSASQTKVRYKLVDVNAGADSVEFDARISDKAGNSTRVKLADGSYRDSFSSSALTGEAEGSDFELAYKADSSSTSAYSLKANPKEPPRLNLSVNETYYNNCKIPVSLKFRYRLYYKTKTSTRELHGHKLFYIQNSESTYKSDSYYVVLMPFGPGNPNLEIIWDGKDHQNSIGSSAPSGVYYISDEPSPEVANLQEPDPLVRLGKKKYFHKFPFKVSNHAVLTLDKWGPTSNPANLALSPSTVPATQPEFIYNRVAHILQRHVYTSPYNGIQYRYEPRNTSVPKVGIVPRFVIKGSKNPGDAQRDVFGEYSPLFNFPSPNTPYGTRFDEKEEFEWPGDMFPVTKREFSRNAKLIQVLNLINGIAHGIRSQPLSDVTITGTYGDGRAMPVVLPDMKLMWAGYFPNAYPQPLGNANAYNSIFPAWKAQQDHESKIK